ncbi:MAG: 2Fe-2S iron-sulfur cluster-binding protein [Planctomycetota bacterium]
MPKITFAANGQVADVPLGTRVLDYCESNETPLAFGCLSGKCGTCVVEVLEGGESLDPRNEDERETLEMHDGTEGCRLACQIKVNGDLTLRQPSS